MPILATDCANGGAYPKVVASSSTHRGKRPAGRPLQDVTSGRGGMRPQQQTQQQQQRYHEKSGVPISCVLVQADDSDDVSAPSSDVEGAVRDPSAAHGRVVRNTDEDDEDEDDDWLEVSCSSSDSSVDQESRGKERPPMLSLPSTAHVPPSPGRRSSTILSPNVLAAIDSSDDDDEADLQGPRERDPIDLSRIPSVGDRPAVEALRGSTLQWAPPRATRVQCGNGQPPPTEGAGSAAGPDAFTPNSMTAFLLRTARLRVPQERALEALYGSAYSFERAEVALRRCAKTAAWPPSSATSHHTIEFPQWTEDEMVLFERAYVESGKTFRDLSEAVGTKTVHECINFYYRWKKMKRGAAVCALRKDVLSHPIPIKVPRTMFVPVSTFTGMAKATARNHGSSGTSHKKKKKSHKKKPPRSDSDADTASSFDRRRLERSHSTRSEVPAAVIATVPAAEPAAEAVASTRKRVREPNGNRGHGEDAGSAVVTEVAERALMSEPKRRREEPSEAYTNPRSTAQHTLPTKQKTPHVRPRTPPSVSSPSPPPPPVSGPDIFTVEAIVDTRKHRKKREFLVKWEGYGHQDNTWEPEENLENNTILLEWQRRTDDGRRK